MRNRDPLLTMAIVRRGWLEGHSLYRAARHCKQRRNCWVASALLALAVVGLAPIWMVRTTLPGTPEGVVDSTRFQVIGNVAGVQA